MKTINIAIDIDDFLTSMEVTKLKQQDSLDPIHHGEGCFFTVSFTYDKCEYDIENVLVPGCIPFFQFLFEHQQVRPAFFSAGVRARNLVLAEKVVQMAIDAGGDPTWMDRYDVFSREDCFDTEALPREMRSARESPYQPPDRYGNLKKDLRMIHYGREAYHALFARACTMCLNATNPARPPFRISFGKRKGIYGQAATFLPRNASLCISLQRGAPFSVNITRH